MRTAQIATIVTTPAMKRTSTHIDGDISDMFADTQDAIDFAIARSENDMVQEDRVKRARAALQPTDMFEDTQEAIDVAIQLSQQVGSSSTSTAKPAIDLSDSDSDGERHTIEIDDTLV